MYGLHSDKTWVYSQIMYNIVYMDHVRTSACKKPCCRRVQPTTEVQKYQKTTYSDKKQSSIVNTNLIPSRNKAFYLVGSLYHMSLLFPISRYSAKFLLSFLTFTPPNIAQI